MKCWNILLGTLRAGAATALSLLVLAASALAAPVPVTGVSTSGNQLVSLEVNGNTYPQAQLVLPTLTAFAAGGVTVPIVPNGSAAPAVNTRAGLLQDWLLDSGLINPAVGASTVAVTFSTPIVNRAGADIVFMEINPGATADPMQVTINGTTQVVAAGSWGATGFTATSADLYSTGTTVASLAALESAALTLSSAEITQNVFGVAVDLSDFGIAANASVSSITFGSSGATTFDPVFIAGINGTGAPPVGPVSLPYIEPFNSGTGSFTGTASWAAVGGAYRNTIATANAASSASILTNDLGGANPANFFLSSKFTVVSQTTTGNAVGFALFGTNSGFTGGVANPYYLLDFRPGANVIRFMRVGINNTLFVPDSTLQTMSVDTAQPFHLEVRGRYEFGALVLDLTVRQGALSETFYAVDSEPLTVGYFGYRNRTGAGGALTVDCDDFTLRHVSTDSFTATPAPFARPGVAYSSSVAAVSDVGANVTLTAVALPPWMSFTPGASGTGTLSGTPTTPGSYAVTLRATDNEDGLLEQTWNVSVLSATGVFISEFLAENDSGLRDEDGDQSDWIELFNSGDAPVSVAGWGLSDDPLLPMKWTLPAGTTIPARGFLVVFASAKNRTAPQLHTNFKLSNAAGANLRLSLPDGSAVSSFLAYPEQRADHSYGTYGSYTTSGYLITPTPGAPNDAIGYNGFVADTQFSVPRGFYTTPQSVAVTCTTPGATIVHTTDGSTPTLTNGTQSASPLTLNIASSTALRVAAFAPNLVPTNVDTASYFFLEDIRQQATTPPPGWPAGPVNGQILQYGMDPDVTTTVTAQQMKDALAALPTIALTTDIPNLFAADGGIYVNPYGREEGYEAPVAVELLNANNTPGFFINAGLRIRGGFSRQGTNPKHSFHLYFRGQYGASKLAFPLFGDDGADEYDRIDLHTTQSISWHAGSSAATFNRDEWNRLTQGAMGHPHTRSRFYHLTINGHYWGLYATQERANSDFAASYYGGKKDDYDVMKTYVIPHRVAAADGDATAWNQLHAAAVAGFATDAAYWAVQGRDANGALDGSPQLLDVDNLIDYTALHYYNGCDDGPVNQSLGVPKNFFAMRPRDGRWGYRFIAHDDESTMIDGRNVSGTTTTGATQSYFNPRWLSQQLEANAKYRLRFADRVQKNWFNGGPVDNPVALARWQALRAELQPAMLAESARWGDAVSGSPFTVAHFNAANDAIETGFLVTRRAVLISQLRARNLFPSFDAPSFSQHGGNVASGFPLGITAPAGTTIYYTLDGSDPQTAGSPIYSAPFALSGVQLTVKTRAKLNATNEWSALTEAVFNIDAALAAPGNLAISEIHYNPPGGGDATEFVELLNRSASRLSLNGVNFTGAFVFTFGNITLEPGARILVVEDAAAFLTAYGATPVVAGQWVGALNNGGDTVILRAANGVEIERVSYLSDATWPAETDGGGYSLVRINAATNPDTSANWRSSTALTGNPGASDSAAPFTGSVLADADADGIPALIEHFLLTADTTSNALPVTAGRTLDGRATLTFTRRLGTDDITATVQSSSDLAAWSNTPTRTSFVNHGNGTATETWTATTPGAQQFLRLRLVK